MIAHGSLIKFKDAASLYLCNSSKIEKSSSTKSYLTIDSHAAIKHAQINEIAIFMGIFVEIPNFVVVYFDNCLYYVYYDRFIIL